MTDRATELRELADTLCEREDVVDAFLAKSFTDRLLIVDVDGPIPDAVAEALRGHQLVPADAVYGEGNGEDAISDLGSVGDATRHHFVDVRTRGTHQSYVID